MRYGGASFSVSVTKALLWRYRDARHVAIHCCMRSSGEGWREAILVGGLTYIGRRVKLYRSLNEPI